MFFTISFFPYVLSICSFLSWPLLFSVIREFSMFFTNYPEACEPFLSKLTNIRSLSSIKLFITDVSSSFRSMFFLILFLLNW